MFGLLKTSSYKQKYIAQSNHIEREKSLKMNFLGNQTEQRKSEKLENEQIGIMKVSVCIKRNQKKKKNHNYQIRRAQPDFYFLLLFFVFFFFEAQSFTLWEREKEGERIQEVKNLYLAFLSFWRKQRSIKRTARAIPVRAWVLRGSYRFASVMPNSVSPRR